MKQDFLDTTESSTQTKLLFCFLIGWFAKWFKVSRKKTKIP